MIALVAGLSGATRHQGGIVGRYILRSVDGTVLPASMQLEDARHKIRITDGSLELRTDGRYVCRTTGETITMGLHEPFTDSVTGGYTVIQGTAITLGTKGGKADTLQANGFQLTWPHAFRMTFARFLYSR
jgi:hypothetical protein